MSEQLQSFIEGMPKTALHMHLEGSLEPELAFSLAQKYKMLPLEIPKAGGGHYSVNSLDELKNVYKFNDLKSFLNIYNTLATTLRSKEDFSALAYAYCEKAISENIRHAEIFFDPQTHISRGLSFAEVTDGIQSGIDQGRKRGLSISVFCSILRDHSIGSKEDDGDINYKSGSNENPYNPTAWSIVKMCIAYNSTANLPGGTSGFRPPEYHLMGIALDNNEVGWPPKLFTNIYDFAWSNGLVNVAHGGEEGPPEYIWECIENLMVIRIDHGIRSIEDPELVSYMATPQNNKEMNRAYNQSHKLPVTVCPLSNNKLKVFTDPKDTNILEMLDLGIMVTVNSDDPAYFGGYVTENYLFLVEYLSKFNKFRSLQLSDIRNLCINGFEASVLPLRKKLSYISEVNNYFINSPGMLYKNLTSNL